LGQLQQALARQRAAVLPGEGLQGRLTLARPQQPLARCLQGVQGGILAFALVLRVHRITLVRWGPHLGVFFLVVLGAGTRTSSRWSRRASATSGGTLRKKRKPVSFSTARAVVRYFVQSKPTVWLFGMMMAMTRLFLLGSAPSRGRTRATFHSLF